MKVLGSKQGEKERQADRHPIVHCEKVHSMTEQMLERAKRGDWEAVTSLEESRQRLLKRSFGQRENRAIDHAAAKQQAALIRKILSIDNQTKELVVKKMVDLRKHFNSEKKLVKAYGPH